jgi:ABC-2 type transport system permease protein
MKEKLQLTRFFVSSFYKMPKQTMLQAVLIIAVFYMFLQLTVVNAFVYFLGDTQVFLFYNLTISSILVFALVCYLSTSQIFAYYEFKVLAPLPLTYKEISKAKVLSSLWVPIILSMVIQVPTMGFLIVDQKFMEAIKLFIFLPIVNGLTALILLFILSCINRYYYKFKNKITYLMVNIAVILMLLIISIVYFAGKSSIAISKVISDIDLNSIEGLKNSLEFIMKHMFETANMIPVINWILDAFVSDEITAHFLVIYISTILISFLLYTFIIENISVNYFKNGLLENNKTNMKNSKVNISKNQWSNYLQREIWIIKSEAYFKMQIVLGLLLPPIFSLVMLLLIQKEVFPNYLDITKEGVFDKYFSYSVLFLSCINNISGTPYSREGKYHYLLKSAPFNERYVYFSKVIFSSIISIIAVVISFLIFALFGHWELESAVMLLIISCLVVCYNLLTPIYDMKNPSIEWENPSAAIKSNPNVLISLLYGFPFLIMVALIHFGLVWFSVQPIMGALIILMIVIVINSVLVNRLKLYL